MNHYTTKKWEWQEKFIKKRAKKQSFLLFDTFQGWAILLKNKQLIGELDRIAQVYSNIPRIQADGIYGEATKAAVKEFQRTFDLPQTGIIDFRTWYKISQIYVGITRIAELNQ